MSGRSQDQPHSSVSPSEPFAFVLEPQQRHGSSMFSCARSLRQEVIHLPPNSIRRASSSPPRMSRRRPMLSSGAAATRDRQPAAPDRARHQRARLLRRPGGAPAETAQRAHQRRRDGGLGSGGRQWRGRSTLASRCACACCRCWCARCPLPRVLDRGRCCVNGGGEDWLVPSARHHARNPPGGSYLAGVPVVLSACGPVLGLVTAVLGANALGFFQSRIRLISSLRPARGHGDANDLARRRLRAGRDCVEMQSAVEC
jgi:hypothetical protein